MPQLPSGLKLAISNAAILEPSREFFKCPEGHFWYQTPDLAINRPPFPRGGQIIMDFAHAPVPENRDEVKQYLHVLVGDADGTFHWEGQMLSEFPRPGQLDEADHEAWNQWLNEDERLRFFDETIEKCRTQADGNRHNTGWFRMVADDDPAETDAFDGDVESLLGIAGRLERDAADAREAEDYDSGQMIHAKLEALLADVRELRSRAGDDYAPAAHAEGFVLRILHRWNDAEAVFRSALRANPYHPEAWLELTWCLAMQGLLDDAEEAARRAVDVSSDRCESWGNLAMVLIQKRDRAGAREALDTALVLDPTDEYNRYIDEHFDAYFEMSVPVEEAN